MKTLPTDYQNQERKTESKANYLYHIRNNDSDIDWYYTSNKKDLSVAGNAALLGADPRVFLAASITHSNIPKSSQYDSHTVGLMTSTEDGRLADFLITASVGVFILTIWRFASDPDETNLVYDDDLIPVFSGQMVDAAFNGLTLTANFIPIFYQMDKPVPRFYFQRTCNHVFGDAFCGVDLEARREDVTVASFSRIQRTVTVNAAQPDDYYGGGYIIENSSGIRVGIASSSGIAGSNTLKLNGWIPELEGTPTIKLYPGCNHLSGVGSTSGDCNDKYNNLENYGGFPFIPLKNPSADGVS